MQHGATMSFAWQAVTPSSAVATTVWSPELADELARYLRTAREYLAADRPQDAVATWEAALHDVPTIPAPRRQAIVQLIRDTVYACARRELQAARFDLRAAAAWLERGLRTLESEDEVEHRRAVRAYAWLLHLRGQAEAALPYYQMSASRSRPDADDMYGQYLARLQTAVAPSLAISSSVGRLGHMPPRADLFRHPLAAPAWHRLQALETLLRGDAGGALYLFPGPDSPALPKPWALEGALLAAMCGRWSIALQYYRRALDRRGLAVLAKDDLHRSVFLAVALRCGRDAETDAVEQIVMTQQLPARPPTGVFTSSAGYRTWAAEVQWRQRRLWVRRALQELTANDDVVGKAVSLEHDFSRYAELRRSLNTIVRLQPQALTSRWLDVWLACTAAPSAAAAPHMKLLRDSVPSDDSAHHIVRLSVLAAERFGDPEHVVARLHLLLHRFPEDAWGVARWRAWMTKLADAAIVEGRFKQALFQYVSLLLYVPDDVVGWRGCADVLELMGENARAEDCRRQAQLISQGAEKSSQPPDDRHVELDILYHLLTDYEEPTPATAGFPFRETALRRAIVESLRAPDVYLRILLERWAKGPTNFPTAG